jgi:hypothetical protein
MSSTYEPIATTTLGSNQSSITFGSGGTLPQTYTDLVIIGNLTGTAGSQVVFVRYNGDSGSNYSKTYLLGNGSSAFSGGNSNETEAVGGDIYTTLTTNIHQIFNYSSTNTYKTQIVRSNNAGQRVGAWINLWRNNNAITSIVLSPSSGLFVTGSTFTLYGIKAE